MGKPEARLIAALRRRVWRWRYDADHNMLSGTSLAWAAGLEEAIDVVREWAAREARRGKVGR